jgi:hypothetical protein
MQKPKRRPKALNVTTEWVDGFIHKYPITSLHDKALEYEIKRLDSFTSLRSYKIVDDQDTVLHEKVPVVHVHSEDTLGSI